MKHLIPFLLILPVWLICLTLELLASGFAAIATLFYYPAQIFYGLLGDISGWFYEKFYEVYSQYEDDDDDEE